MRNQPWIQRVALEHPAFAGALKAAICLSGKTPAESKICEGFQASRIRFFVPIFHSEVIQNNQFAQEGGVKSQFCVFRTVKLQDARTPSKTMGYSQSPARLTAAVKL